jgi:hypothetical protein
MSTQPLEILPPGKFVDPFVTAKGEVRAEVALTKLDTLWFNTGTLCNIECLNCYIESSPSNDRLVYLCLDDVKGYLDEIERDGLGTREIGFTGGEPFLNPAMVEIIAECLSRGFEVMMLSNAMRPLMRKRVQAGLLALPAEQKARLTFRVSLDHFTAEFHDQERNKAGAFEEALTGLAWLRDHGIALHIAGRSCWGEDEATARAGYAALFAQRGLPINADSRMELVIFPEMDEEAVVPEITVDCWGILGLSPDAMMCASSRMVVKRKGAAAAAVVACTLLPYSDEFELGATLADASVAVKLNHPHCAKFCVLGGGSCSA